MLNRLPFLALIPFTFASPALAAEAADAESIVVTATGSALPADQTGQTVTVIDHAGIEAIQGPDLTRALARIPGVAFSRTGAIGATTSLFVRGADSNQVLVLVDGVRLADNAAPDGKYDLGTLLLDNLDRIELLRGSNSVIWGSQAMAGVLSLTTREVDGAQASVEHGAYDTTNATAALGIARPTYAISLDGGYLHSDGFPPLVGSTTEGAIDSWRIGGKARLALGRHVTLKARLRYTDANLGIDQFGPVAQHTHDTSGGVALEYHGGPLQLAADASLADVRRHYRDTPFPSDYQGLTERFALTGRLALPSHLALDFGADHQWDRAFSTYDPRVTATLDSGHALLGYYSDAFSLAAGGRVDSHDRFGTHWTTGANTVIRLAPGLRLRAAYGEGFKAPTLYQLYAGFGQGNPDLRPETTRSYDAGVEYRTDRFHASATWFRRDSHDLVDYVNFHYINIEKARSVGVELETGVKLGETLEFAANYTWLSPRDLIRDRDLPRRPRHTVNLAADWQTPLPGLKLGADLRVASQSFEYNGAAAQPLRSYVLATLRASYAIDRHLELFGRIENLGDVDYHTAYNFSSGQFYATSGRAAYVGIRGKI
jgi:vitamin B12 transporter